MVYRLIYTLVLWMSYIPRPVGRFLGSMLGSLVFLLPMKRKSIAVGSVMKSVKLTGDKTGDRKAAQRIMRRVFVHFGRMFFEVPHILRLDRRNIDRYVVYEGRENLEKALRKGKGAFVLTAHFGNWELMSAALSMSLERSAVVVRSIDFAPFERLMTTLRTRFGCHIIEKQKAMRQLLAAVKDEKTVGILLDQNVDWYEGAFVKFLGRWACANKGLALIALRTGTPVIPVFPVRQGDGRYRIIFEEEVPLIRTGDKTRDVEDNTALFSSIIERYIRKYPDHWFWFHRRWKTRPYCPLPDDYYLKKN